MITEDYVSFETAKFLKEKGFDEPCHALYHNGDDKIFFGLDVDSYHNTNLNVDCYACPTLQMAMKWLRNEKGIAIIPIIDSILDHEKFLWDIKIVVAKTNETFSQGWVYENPESGYDRAIRYCLEILI